MTTNEALVNGVFSISRVNTRTVEYEDAEKTKQSFQITDVTFVEEGLKAMNVGGDINDIKVISFNPSYFKAKLLLLPAMEQYVKDEHKLIPEDDFYKELSMELVQTAHAANTPIPGTNKLYANTGISTEIVKFVPSKLAIAELKRSMFASALMTKQAEAQTKVVKGLLAAKANAVIAALDAFAQFEDDDDAPIINEGDAPKLESEAPKTEPESKPEIINVVNDAPAE